MGYLRLKKGDTSRKAKERDAEVQKAAPQQQPRAQRATPRASGKRTPWGTVSSNANHSNGRRASNTGHDPRSTYHEDREPNFTHRHVYDMTPEEIRAAQIQMARMALRRSSEE